MKYLGGKPRFIKGIINLRVREPEKAAFHVAVERRCRTVNAEVVTGDSYAELSLRVGPGGFTGSTSHDGSVGHLQVYW